MKKLKIVFPLVLAVGLISSPAFGLVHYCKDVLEPGNQGGWSASLKTWDESVVLMESDTVVIDIWANSFPNNGEGLIGGGVEITHSLSVGITEVQVYDGVNGPPGPWDPSMTSITQGAGTLLVTVGNLSLAVPDAQDDLLLIRITVHCEDFGFDEMTIDTPALGTWFVKFPSKTVYDDEIEPNVFMFNQVRCCDNGVDCMDSSYCNGAENCGNDTLGVCGGQGICYKGTPPNCDDSNPCTDDTCNDDTLRCENVCNAVSPDDPCCENEVCVNMPVCTEGSVINLGDQWANCGDVGVKIPICLVNLYDEVGAVQVDLCEDINDCLVCVGCEMTERTVIFDCMINELENGCCAVVVFSKNPGGVINPGECDIVVIDYTLKDEPQCCNNCIEINGENVEVVNQYGYLVKTVVGDTGMVCPFECGDVEPAASTATTWNCGDGDVDIFDILEEVDFIIHVKTPDNCQLVRADTPTGTPPDCDPPDGAIDVGDLMVIIDMALNRQDCCSYYYGGVIY